MKKLLEFIVKNIVASPDKVLIEEREENSQINLNLDVDSEDMGIIIGKSGRTIKAIRTLLKIKAIKEGKHVYLNLVEKST